MPSAAAAALRQELRLCYVTYASPWRPRYGGALRSHGIVAGLAERCEVHVVLAADGAGDVAGFAEAADRPDVAVHTLAAAGRLRRADDWAAGRSVVGYVGRGKYHRALRDVLHAVRPDITWYFDAETVHRCGLQRAGHIVIDHCDVHWRKHLRYAEISGGMARLRRLAKAAVARLDEVALALRADLSTVAAPGEVALLRPARQVRVLPNGFAFPARPDIRPRTGRRLLFVGSLFYPPNVDGIRWFAASVWPDVRRAVPDAELHVVGHGDADVFAAGLPPGVIQHGAVDDVAPHFEAASVLVVPLRISGGTRIKVLEAWARGLPVASTAVGIEGLGAVDGQTARVAAPGALAAACVDLLRHPQAGAAIAGRAFVHGRRCFDWPAVYRTLDDILAGVRGRVAIGAQRGIPAR